MAADNYVNSPGGVELCGKLFILFKTDMGKKNGKVDINSVIGVTNSSDFFGSLAYINKASYNSVVFGLSHNLFGKNADKEDFHSVNLFNQKRIKQSCIICFDMQVCVDYREFCTFFKKEKMRNTVIGFVVAEGYNVGSEHIHNFNG